MNGCCISIISRRRRFVRRLSLSPELHSSSWLIRRQHQASRVDLRQEDLERCLRRGQQLFFAASGTLISGCLCLCRWPTRQAVSRSDPQSGPLATKSTLVAIFDHRRRSFAAKLLFVVCGQQQQQLIGRMRRGSPLDALDSFAISRPAKSCVLGASFSHSNCNCNCNDDQQTTLDS